VSSTFHAARRVAGQKPHPQLSVALARGAREAVGGHTGTFFCRVNIHRACLIVSQRRGVELTGAAERATGRWEYGKKDCMLDAGWVCRTPDSLAGLQSSAVISRSCLEYKVRRAWSIYTCLSGSSWLRSIGSSMHISDSLKRRFGWSFAAPVHDWLWKPIRQSTIITAFVAGLRGEWE
jgi:hypothetical protein